MVRPNEILPMLHNKTHYKAAHEYALLDKDLNRSLCDKHREIEKQLEET